MKSLKELSIRELKNLYDKNKSWQDKVDNEVLDEQLATQDRLCDDIFGEENRTIKYHSHYNTFYLSITDQIEFPGSLNKDSLSEEQADLLDECKKALEQYMSLSDEDQLSEKGDNLYEKLLKKNNKLLSMIEKDLHSYENISDEAVEDTLQRIIDGAHSMSNWRTDGEKVYYSVEYILG